MKIIGVHTYLVRPRWGFVEILTDAGISGWGEPVLEGHCSTVQACVQEMESYLLGENPMCIEDIWTKLFRCGFYRGGGVLMSAISGIDQALWDIKGKYFGVPAYELLGGACRNKVKVYSWVGGDRPADVAAAAKDRKNAGFPAVKMNGTEELQMIDSYEKIDAVLERVAAVRERCGKYFGIAIDFHGRVHKPLAKILAKNWKNSTLCLLKSPSCVKTWNIFLRLQRHAIFRLPRENVFLQNMIISGYCKPAA
nr:galactonate dehydratase [Marasmitruncus massiliensis]